MEFILVIVFFGSCTKFLVEKSNLRLDRLEHFLLSAPLAGENKTVLALLFDCPGLGHLDADGDGQPDAPIAMGSTNVQRGQERNGQVDGFLTEKQMLDERLDRPQTREEIKREVKKDEERVNLHFAMNIYYARFGTITAAAVGPIIVAAFGLSCVESVQVSDCTAAAKV